MKGEIFRLQDVSAEKMVELAEAIAHGTSEIDRIAKYLGVGETHVIKIVNMAIQIGMVSMENDQLTISEEDRRQLLTSDDTGKKVIFLKYLRKFQPFTKFYDFLSLGYPPLVSARKVCAIFKIDRQEASVLRMLKSWGLYAGLFENSEQLIRDDLINVSIPKLDDLRHALENEMAANQYLKQILGEEAYGSVNQQDIEELVKAMVEFMSNPRDAIKKTREVLEDYLSDYGNATGVDIAAEGTLSRKITKLRQNQKIARKHVPILEGLEVFMDEQVMKSVGAFGNLTHHGKIDEEQQRWSVSSEIALCVILETIMTIRSIFLYGIKKQTSY